MTATAAPEEPRTATSVPPADVQATGAGEAVPTGAGAAQASAVAGHAVAAEVALAAVTLSVVYGFSRLFSGWGFFGPLALIAVTAHLTLGFARRRNWGIPLAALAVIATTAVVAAWSILPDSLTYLLPGPRTVGAARDALAASWQTFQSVVAPAPVEAGFVLTSAAALVFAVFLADWAAFRLWSPWEALVPAVTLFAFASLLGSTEHRVDAAAVFAAGVLVFLLLHRVARLDTDRSWLDGARGVGAGSLIGPGLTIAAVAVAAGALLGPHLPGAQSNAVWSFRGGSSGPGSRTTLSPLVDIQDRLVQQADVEVFTVRSDRRAYWRMTSLDTFEGDIWRSSGKYAAADGDLPSDIPSSVATNESNQRFRIGALDVLWLPAAFEPTYVSPETEGTAVRYQQESATLIVDTDLTNSDGLQYQVRSAIPAFTEQQLRAGTAAPPPDIANRYLALPGDFSPTARATAEKVAGGEPTPYEKARALQDWFQTDFTYSLDVPKGHGENAIDAFLQNRKGYCEQFAGTYAAMARSLGIPARVAVGFTPGDPDRGDAQLFHVRGEHAHAWPEVWIAGAGWVPMEPTPGRGAPDAQNWTGLPEQQDQSGPALTGTTLPVTTTTPQPTTPGTTPDLPVAAATTLPAPPPPEPPSGFSLGDLPLAAQAGLVGLVILLGAVLYVVALVAADRRRRVQRRRDAGTAPTTVQTAWQDTVEALALVGASHAPSETHSEFARRAGTQVEPAAAALTELATDADMALYAPDVVSDDVAGRARAAADQVVGIVDARTTATDRWRDVVRRRAFWYRWRGRSRRSADR